MFKTRPIFTSSGCIRGYSRGTIKKAGNPLGVAGLLLIILPRYSVGCTLPSSLTLENGCIVASLVSFNTLSVEPKDDGVWCVVKEDPWALSYRIFRELAYPSNAIVRVSKLCAVQRATLISCNHLLALLAGKV